MGVEITRRKILVRDLFKQDAEVHNQTKLTEISATAKWF
jgi:hypothetical protein